MPCCWPSYLAASSWSWGAYVWVRLLLCLWGGLSAAPSVPKHMPLPFSTCSLNLCLYVCGCHSWPSLAQILASLSFTPNQKKLFIPLPLYTPFPACIYPCPLGLGRGGPTLSSLLANQASCWISSPALSLKASPLQPPSPLVLGRSR